MIDKNIYPNNKNNTSSSLTSKTIIINWLKTLFFDLTIHTKI